jgi:hypothetical protein
MITQMSGKVYFITSALMSGERLAYGPVSTTTAPTLKEVTLEAMQTNTSFCFLPDRIAAWAAASDVIRFYDLDSGAKCTDERATCFAAGAATGTFCACDGTDLLIAEDDTGGATLHAVWRYRLQKSAPTMRRYDPTDWRPLCRSLAVEAR